ncbi:hypothetical protein COB55_02505 [Candidatus Wolfebacteria bacterium]|nr:MAG: hypothetical protein COB55_02505 [Candidatus Wolfebacteria bacterium]
MSLIARWIVAALGLLLSGYVLVGVSISTFYVALIVAVLLGLVNITIKPILLLLAFPINFLTLGLFTFVINAGLFWFISSFVSGFTVDGFIGALGGSLILSLVVLVGGKFIDAIR